ncbi:hypothetical protein Ciccas_009503 [Cichlidogyrus casuarinus]|uniref:Uncharacterized protein n=1 Tax=Cichlidogyrus casuarinus TaxID=1844966 RepID=A0ABD2PXU2_9PLAT
MITQLKYRGSEAKINVVVCSFGRPSMNSQNYLQVTPHPDREKAHSIITGLSCPPYHHDDGEDAVADETTECYADDDVPEW